MKRALLTIAMVLIFSGLAISQQVIVIPNQTTVYWDADPADEALPGTLFYQVFVVTEATDKTTVDLTAPDYETDQLSQLVTLPAEGKFIVGVRTKRLLDDGVTEVFEPDVNWSDVNGPETPTPFVYLYVTSPNGCTNLRPTP